MLSSGININKPHSVISSYWWYFRESLENSEHLCVCQVISVWAPGDSGVNWLPRRTMKTLASAAEYKQQQRWRKYISVAVDGLVWIEIDRCWQWLLNRVVNHAIFQSPTYYYLLVKKKLFPSPFASIWSTRGIRVDRVNYSRTKHLNPKKRAPIPFKMALWRPLSSHRKYRHKPSQSASTRPETGVNCVIKRTLLQFDAGSRNGVEPSDIDDRKNICWCNQCVQICGNMDTIQV